MKTALILGASGRFSRHCATALRTQGWEVRMYDRTQGDIMAQGQGVQLIIHGMNPRYADWAHDIPAITQEVQALALQTNALVVLAGNFYNYGIEPAPWCAQTPWKPVNALGQIRVEMENQLRAANARIFTIRCGDFIDTRPSGNWFDQVMIKSLARGKLTAMGHIKCPHSWAYLPDVARAVAEFVTPTHQTIVSQELLFPGYTLSAEDLAQAFTDLLDRKITAKPMNWGMIHLLRPFWREAHYFVKMRYLWDHPHYVDPKGFQTALPNFEPTPIEKALGHAAAHLQLS